MTLDDLYKKVQNKYSLSDDWYLAYLDTCDNCESKAHIIQMLPRSKTGKKYCNTCRDTHTVCSRCGELYSIRDVPEHLRNDFECPKCTNHNLDYTTRWSSVYPYSTNVLDIHGFKYEKLENKQPLFGIELELLFKCKTRDEYIKIVRDVEAMLPENYSILKVDSSVTPGAELVTIPAPMYVHIEHLSKLYANDGFLNCLAGFNNQVGMHVHVSKKHVSKSKLLKLVNVIYDDRNLDIFSDVAGRLNNHYCRVDLHSEYKNRLITPSILQQVTGKYYAINVHGNEKTIEIRFFKSPKSVAQLQTRLRLVERLLSFVDTISMVDLKQNYTKKLREYLCV